MASKATSANKKTVAGNGGKSARSEKSASKKPVGKSADIEKAKPSKQTVAKSAGKTVAKKKPGAKSQSASAALAKSGKSQVKTKASAKSDDCPINVDLVSHADAQKMMDLLRKQYPDAECELTYKNDFELLISVILSAQTTDVQVNKVTPKLFAKFSTPRALAEADIEDVKEIVKPTGYYNGKAKSIQTCAQALVNQFGSKVPDNLDELVKLPGVGRKTANVVLGVIHKIPGWAVDTHVQRLSKRMGFTHNEDPLKIELDLQKLFPNKDWSLYGITMIFHGRRMCFARNPDCPSCPINHLCPSSQV